MRYATDDVYALELPPSRWEHEDDRAGRLVLERWLTMALVVALVVALCYEYTAIVTELFGRISLALEGR